MLNIKTKKITLQGKEYEIEIGRMANQADAAVVCKRGDTHVLCTVSYSKKASETADFFPLTVNYIEKFYAFGKIPGGFIKREGKVSEKETLTSRVIDRAIRPMFPEGFYNEVQVICTLLSYDSENDPEVIAMLGTCCALKLSGLPISNTVAGLRVALIDDEFVINPAQKQLAQENCRLDLFMAGTSSSVVMVESGAKELSEAKILEGLNFGKTVIAEAVRGIDEIYSELGHKKLEFQADLSEIQNFSSEILKNFNEKIVEAYSVHEKKARLSGIDTLKSEVVKSYEAKITAGEISESVVKQAFSDALYNFVRNDILEHNKRIGDRGLDEVREIEIQTGILPRAHGSALFCRGETQALAVTTLGSASDMQMVEGVDGISREKFMLHYNFPPFSVGEVGRLGAPGRREIGHGKLAQRAILPMLDLNECEYTIRTVSEIVTCNGSSSMATVCGTSLSLMSAGVSLKKHVAGIAMGLIKKGEKFAVLTDIMADEDFLGDMDFKVAGTVDGITALQMDIKIDGISQEILNIALDKAKNARLFLLEKMNAVISEPSTNLNEFVPQVEKITINPKSIGEVIGKGGATIKQLSEEFACKIDIEESGIVSIYGSKENTLKAREIVEMIVTDPQRGSIYKGTVYEIKSFGAMVKFMFNKTGMVHISQISNDRIEKIEDVLSVGQEVEVQYAGIDEKRRVKLTMLFGDNAKTSAKKVENTEKDFQNSKSEEATDCNSISNEETTADNSENVVDIDLDASSLINSRVPSESEVEMKKMKNTYYSN